LFGGIRQIIEQARGRVQQQVNSAMVEAYWHPEFDSILGSFAYFLP
jgi:hypothetical protein